MLRALCPDHAKRELCPGTNSQRRWPEVGFEEVNCRLVERFFPSRGLRGSSRGSNFSATQVL